MARASAAPRSWTRRPSAGRCTRALPLWVRTPATWRRSSRPRATPTPRARWETAGNDIPRLVQLSQEDGISDAVPRFVARIFRQAIDAGHGAAGQIEGSR
ncbi:hypothetical protein [Myxococcus sp. AS-1-15]|uniref:imine reductase family protein n=1 Tax=Myxococcus sp. AS-1-15 TaxID=2874600 RepID=UPI00351D22A8